MMTDAHDIEGLLSGTPLADLPTGYGPGGTIIVRNVPPDRLLAAWQTAYDLVPVTGRWPLLVTDWADSLRISADPTPGPTEAKLAALVQAARISDPWPSFRSDDRLVADDAGGVLRGRAGVDLSEQGKRELSLPATEEQIGRWAYERVLADPVLTARVRESAGYAVRTDRWFTPDNVSLLLLPTDSPWLTAAWTHYFPTLGMPREVLAAVFWQWHQRWDARLVAFWDTMLQFTVHRPPDPGPDAWELAGQIKSLAGNLEMTRWELAVVLPEGRAWFLHDRP